MTKFLNISTDTTLGGNAPSDELAVSQKAIKTYVDNHSGGGGLPDQTGHAGEFLTTDGTDASWSDAIGYHPDLFDWKWSDYEISDMQWLRGDTFSWQDGTVYANAYGHLEDDITGKSLTSETVAGITVQFYLADDGHKICPATQESNVSAVYVATGAAWYYIIDTVNTRFKLPRAKHNKYADTLPVAGNGIALGTTDGTYSASLGTDGNGLYWPSTLGYGAAVGSGAGGTGQLAGRNIGITTDSSKSGMIAEQTQDTEQYKYLYFYIGSFTQSAIENTAGLNASLFNGKADLNLNNVSAGIDFVVESQLPTALNNYTWYRKYKSGWVEQGGQIAQSGDNVAVTLPVEMADTNYSVVGGILDRSGAYGWRYASRTTTGFTKNLVGSTDCGGSWVVCGVAAS